ncbi:hypothetical protein COT97_01780 [Candidatus Falkowbacteria bacterium CG10_big_fil_rev_8_21_14_0_10_39_11]|uniref:Uncharacterized protein n=1 Tax=Candidatus Falkowbacteria bacterium CG10_big_fil_rev_8_21_14_0_10_39_11 TaxID=1974565 RepID=A0A2H0V7F7_9BACT|nr:MAG: hypothetical protein COT97_01780 [Candidatus Falkowbacteria bacterium CG10_big_fil_rev_8_21_14_0_10_39_11]
MRNGKTLVVVQVRPRIADPAEPLQAPSGADPDASPDQVFVITPPDRESSRSFFNIDKINKT